MLIQSHDEKVKRDKREYWDMAGMISTYAVSPHMKKGVKPQDIFKNPYDILEEKLNPRKGEILQPDHKDAIAFRSFIEKQILEKKIQPIKAEREKWQEQIESGK